MCQSGQKVGVANYIIEDLAEEATGLGAARHDGTRT